MHTQGPWEASKPKGSNGFWNVDKAGRSFGTGAVATCYSRDAEDNARLIVAAPDMLEALEIVAHELTNRMLSEGICECEDNSEEFCWLCNLRDTARGAISMAKRVEEREEDIDVGDGWEACSREEAEQCQSSRHGVIVQAWTDLCRTPDGLIVGGEDNRFDWEYRRRGQPAAEPEVEEWPVGRDAYCTGELTFTDDGKSRDWQWCIAQRDRFGGFVSIDWEAPRAIPWAMHGYDVEYATHVRMKREG